MYTWMKNLALYYIFLTAIQNFLPDSRYTKYIRYFMGLLLILLVTAPILQLLKLDSPIKENFDRYMLEEQFEESRWGAFSEDTSQEDYLIKSYQKQIGEEMQSYLEKNGYRVNHLEVSVSLEKEASLTSAAVYLAGAYTQEKETQVKKLLAETYGIPQDQIQIKFYNSVTG